MMTWSPIDYRFLFQKYVQIGPKWVNLADLMPGKSPNCLKNHFYGTIRKILRIIKSFLRQKCDKIQKIFKFEHIIRIFDGNMKEKLMLYPEGPSNIEYMYKLQIKLIDFAIECEFQVESVYLVVEDLITKLEKFHTIVKEADRLQKIKLKKQASRTQAQSISQKSGQNALQKPTQNSDSINLVNNNISTTKINSDSPQLQQLKAINPFYRCLYLNISGYFSLNKT